MSTPQGQMTSMGTLRDAGFGGLSLPVIDRDAVYHELARLETAHAQLLRYAQDLKQAYEAERQRRATLARATLDLMTVLSTALTFDEAEALDATAA